MLPEVLRALRDVTKAEAAALINRDGGVVAAELLPGTSHETFSIMCAAILGAGMTAMMELRHRAPSRVLVESPDGMILIQEVGRRHMVVLSLPAGTPLDRLDGVIQRFSESVKRELS